MGKLLSYLYSLKTKVVLAIAEQQPTPANENIENIWSRIGGKTRILELIDPNLPLN